MWKNDVSQKVDALPELSDVHFIGVQQQVETGGKKVANCSFQSIKVFMIVVEKNEVIGVAEVVLRFQSVLRELVKFVEVNIGEEL